jgi:flagellar hook-associated protein 1 FlgK
MGSLFTSLDIAVSGLLSHQTAIQVTGHNIANVDTDGYSRQRAELVSQMPQNTPYGPLGRGVAVADIFRIRDPFLDAVFQSETQNFMELNVERDFLFRIEDIFQEPGEVGLSALMDEFFGTIAALANYPEQLPLRASLIASASVLAENFNDIDSRLEQIRTDANNEIIMRVSEVNSLTEQIAELNRTIVRAEAGGDTANDLRDQRTVLLDELAELVDIHTVAMTNGSTSVLVGGEVLVDGIYWTELTTQVNPALDPDRGDLVDVVIASSGRVLNISGGRFRGLLDTRDVHAPEVLTRIDDLASTLIFELNRIHSQGTGLAGFTSLTSDNAVLDPLADLDDSLGTGLPFTPTDGSFEINVLDSLGNIVTTVITVDLDGVGADDSLTDLAANIDALANISASVSADNQLVITADPTYSFTLSNDTSNVLAVVGANTFFSGSDASDIAVNSVIVNDPTLIAASLSPDPLATGDNRNALAMAALQDTAVLDSGTFTLNDHYEQTIGNLGTTTRRTSDEAIIAANFRQNIDRRREEVAGVSLDEEAANLTRFQRGFQASARVFSVVDELLDTLINGLF